MDYIQLPPEAGVSTLGKTVRWFLVVGAGASSSSLATGNLLLLISFRPFAILSVAAAGVVTDAAIALVGAFLRAHVIIRGPSYSDPDGLLILPSLPRLDPAAGTETSTTGRATLPFVLVGPLILLICLCGGSSFSLSDTLSALVAPLVSSAPLQPWINLPSWSAIC